MILHVRSRHTEVMFMQTAKLAGIRVYSSAFYWNEVPEQQLER
ncbi:hypothetical protein [Paenibacillus sp. sgz302251]